LVRITAAGTIRARLKVYGLHTSPFVIFEEFRAMTEERKRMSIEEIEAVALGLPGEQLDELIDRLAAHRGMNPDLEQEWLDEVQRRVAEYDAGEVKGIPMEETLAKLRAMLR
jgi:putative addiction module component (TIGR02574 family)